MSFFFLSNVDQVSAGSAAQLSSFTIQFSCISLPLAAGFNAETVFNHPCPLEKPPPLNHNTPPPSRRLGQLNQVAVDRREGKGRGSTAETESLLRDFHGSQVKRRAPAAPGSVALPLQSTYW